jgi:hypothetical protein
VGIWMTNDDGVFHDDSTAEAGDSTRWGP